MTHPDTPAPAPHSPSMKPLKFGCAAMHTRFEIIACHEDRRYAEQAASEAFRRLGMLEQAFSRFIDNSDISRINRSRPGVPVQVGTDAFECLALSLSLSRMTGRAFDVTALSRCRHNPWESLVLDETRFEVTRRTPETMLDLGGIGKGFALDRMADVLKEWEIPSALIHGGSSTALALEAPPGEEGWKVTVSRPLLAAAESFPEKASAGLIAGQDFPNAGKTAPDFPPDLPAGPPEPMPSRLILATVRLARRALSGSGREKGNHIIDPRTGEPVSERIAAWAASPEAATADALSTAFMVMTVQEIGAFCSLHPDTSARIAEKNASPTWGSGCI